MGAFRTITPDSPHHPGPFQLRASPFPRGNRDLHISGRPNVNVPGAVDRRGADFWRAQWVAEIIDRQPISSIEAAHDFPLPGGGIDASDDETLLEGRRS